MTTNTPAKYTPLVDPTAPNPRPAERLVATVNGTADHPEIRGTVAFRKVGDNVEVRSDIENLPPGTHAYHVHLYGDCSDPAESAGPHLDFRAIPQSTASVAPGTGARSVPGDQGRTDRGGNVPATPPSQTPTGAPTDAGTTAQTETPATTTTGAASPAITGNLGDLGAVKAKSTTGATTLPMRAAEMGALTGRAVVIHADANDPKSPDGGAGAPIACGVVGVANDALASVDEDEERETPMPRVPTTPGPGSSPGPVPNQR
jgi:Cu/Zn superoxide dismutase